MMYRPIWILVVTLAVAAGAGLGLTTQPSRRGIDERLKGLGSARNANECLGQIESGLYGYSKLTDTINASLWKGHRIDIQNRKNIPKDGKLTISMTVDAYRSFDHIGWEEQNIGFPNWIKHVRGHIEFQQYENMKLRLELMRLKESRKSDIDRLAKKVDRARSRLASEYLDETKWVD